MELQQRKPNRLKEYDYSQNGAYFITICTKNRAPILSEIVGGGDLDAPWHNYNAAPWHINNTTPRNIDNAVRKISQNNTVQIKLTEYGMIAEEYIKSMRNDKYKIIIDAYVIMPDHVHFVLTITPIVGGDVPAPRECNSPAPRERQMQIVPRVVTWFKRFTNKSAGFDLWQRSYHDHVIRDEQDYLNICQYIADNPMRWMNR